MNPSMVAKGGNDCAIGNKNVVFQFYDLEFVFLETEQYDIADMGKRLL